MNGQCIGGYGGPNNYYYTNGPLFGSIGGSINGIGSENSMRKSMLLRKIWNKELRRKNYSNSKDTRSGSWSPPLRRTQRRLYTNSSFGESLDNTTTSGERCKECEKIENESIEGSPKRLRLISSSTSSLTSVTPSTKSADSSNRFGRNNSCDSNDKEAVLSSITHSAETQGAPTSSSSSRQQGTTTTTGYSQSSRTDTPAGASNQTTAPANRKTVLIYMTSMDTPSPDETDNGNMVKQDVLRIEVEAPTPATATATATTKSSSSSKLSSSTDIKSTTTSDSNRERTTESSGYLPMSSADDNQEGYTVNKRDISASSGGDESCFSDNNNNNTNISVKENTNNINNNTVIELNANTISDDYPASQTNTITDNAIDQKLDLFISQMLIDNLNNVVLDTDANFDLKNQINNNNNNGININVNDNENNAITNGEDENENVKVNVNLNELDIHNAKLKESKPKPYKIVMLEKPNENSKVKKKPTRNGVNQIKNHELRTQDYNKLVINENHENILNNNNSSSNNNHNTNTNTNANDDGNNTINDILPNERMCNTSNISTPDRKSNKTVNSCYSNSEEVIAPDGDDIIDADELDIETINTNNNNNNNALINFSENSFRLVSSAATPLSSLPPSFQQLVNIGEFQISETFTGIHYFPIYTHDPGSADLSSHTSCCSDTDLQDLGPVGTGSTYPQFSFTHPVLVQRLSAYPRTESMEVQPSSTSVCEDDIDGSSDDSISLVDSLDEPITPKKRSNKLKINAVEEQSIVRKSPEAFFVPIVDGAQQIDEHVVVADTMPDKIKEKLEKRQKKRDQKKEQDVKKKQKKVQKFMEKKFGDISVNGRGIKKEHVGGAGSDGGSGIGGRFISISASNNSSVGGSASNSLINTGGSGTKNGNNKIKTNNSVTTSQPQQLNSTTKVVKSKKSMRNEIGLLESYKIDSKGNMQFQTPNSKVDSNSHQSGVSNNNTTLSSSKSIAFKLRNNSTSSQFNAKGMVKPKTSDIASIRRSSVANDEKSVQESRRKQVLKDVQQMTLYQQADLTPDTEGGPRRMYQKTEIQEGDKRIEILEIVECGESSEENSPTRHHMPSRSNSSRSGRRSRIPVPIFRAGRSSGYQKSIRVISREGSPVTTPKSFSRNASPSSGNPKVDRMIADLLIEALNNPDDVGVEFIKSPKEFREKSGKRQSAARRTPSVSTVIPGQRRSAHSSSKYRQKFEVIPEERSSMSVDSSTDEHSSAINSGSSSVHLLYPPPHIYIKDITNCMHGPDVSKKSPVLQSKSFATIELSPKLENLTPEVKHRNSPWLKGSSNPRFQDRGGAMSVFVPAASSKHFVESSNENYTADILRIETLSSAGLKDKPPKIPNRARKSDSSADSSPRLKQKNELVRQGTSVSTPGSSVNDEGICKK